MMRWKAKAALGIAGITLLAATAWSVYNAGYRAGESKIQAKWDAEVAQMAQAQAMEITQAREREQALQAQVDQIRRTHRNEISRISREHSALVDSLRNRPEARAGVGGVPDSPDSGVGCTGAGLSRADSEFLVWLGGEAARTQAALNACLTAYDEVRRSLIRP